MASLLGYIEPPNAYFTDDFEEDTLPLNDAIMWEMRQSCEEFTVPELAVYDYIGKGVSTAEFFGGKMDDEIRKLLPAYLPPMPVHIFKSKYWRGLAEDEFDPPRQPEEPCATRMNKFVWDTIRIDLASNNRSYILTSEAERELVVNERKKHALYKHTGHITNQVRDMWFGILRNRAGRQYSDHEAEVVESVYCDRERAITSELKQWAHALGLAKICDERAMRLTRAVQHYYVHHCRQSYTNNNQTTSKNKDCSIFKKINFLPTGIAQLIARYTNKSYGDMGIDVFRDRQEKLAWIDVLCEDTQPDEYMLMLMDYVPDHKDIAKLITRFIVPPENYELENLVWGHRRQMYPIITGQFDDWSISKFIGYSEGYFNRPPSTFPYYEERYIESGLYGHGMIVRYGEVKRLQVQCAVDNRSFAVLMPYEREPLPLSVLAAEITSTDTGIPMARVLSNSQDFKAPPGPTYLKDGYGVYIELERCMPMVIEVLAENHHIPVVVALGKKAMIRCIQYYQSQTAKGQRCLRLSRHFELMSTRRLMAQLRSLNGYEDKNLGEYSREEMIGICTRHQLRKSNKLQKKLTFRAF